MKFTSTFALGVALAASGMILATPATAQKKKAEAAAEEAAAPGRKFDLSKEGRPALAALQKVVDAKDAAGFPAALAAAQATAKTNDDRYLIGQFHLRHAIDVNDEPAKLVAVQAMIQSGGAQASELPTLYSNLGALAYAAKNFDVAVDAFTKLDELQPTNTDAAINVAKIRAQQKRYPEAVTELETLIAREKAAGRKLAETNYRLALQFALDGKVSAKVPALSSALLTDYPTPENWRIALSLYRDAAQLDKPAELDLMRLMRASKSLESERDWFDLADAANTAGLPGEAKSVLDEAIAARKVDPNKQTFKELLTVANDRAAEDRKTLAGSEKTATAAPTGRPLLNLADAYLGYGDYAKAAQFYRAAMEKGSIDANVANTRLGIALAMQGNKAEAETALKAVSGARSEIASMWLIWLGQRA